MFAAVPDSSPAADSMRQPKGSPASGSATWPRIEAHLAKFEPEFVVFQCGADGLRGDPLAHLQYSPATHAFAARRLALIADRFSAGRLMAFGGGGYDRDNLAKAWTAVLDEIVGRKASIPKM